MDTKRAKATFRAYCKRVGIEESEGILGGVKMLVPGEKPPFPGGKMIYSQTVMHSLIEVRSFRPEVLIAVFDLTPDGIESLMERANKVEHAHNLWLAADV